MFGKPCRNLSDTHSEASDLHADYGKHSKISYTKVSDKMAYANSEDPEKTAPQESTLFAIPLIILRNNCTKSKSIK